MPKPNQGKGNKGRKNPGMKYYKQALQEVMMSIQPLMNQLDRAKKQGRQDYRNAYTRTGNVYSGLQNELQNVAGQYGAQTAGIPDQLSQQLASTAGLFGNTMAMADPAENQAGRNMATTIGAGAYQNLASDASRNAAYNASTQRQGALEKMTARRNLTKDWQDYKRDLAQQGIDIMEQVPGQAQVLSRNLRNDAFNRRMSLSQLGLQERSLGLQEDALAAEERRAAAQADYTRRTINRIIAAIQGQGVPVSGFGDGPGGGPGMDALNYAGLGDTAYTTPSGNMAPYVGTTGTTQTPVNTSFNPWQAKALSDWLYQILHGGSTIP